MNRYKSLFTDTILIGVGNFTTHLIYFFLMPIYTLSMSAEEFGLADLLSNFASLLLPFLTLSISEGVFRFVLDKNEDPNELLTSGLKIIGLCAIILMSALTITYYVTHKSYGAYFFFYFISEALKGLLAQFSRGVGNVRDFSLSGIIAAVLLFVSTYTLVKQYRLGVEGYLFAFIIANTVAIIYLCLSVRAIRRFVWSYSDTKQKEMLLYSLPLIPNTLFWWATNISSRYILAYQCGMALAGFFAATSKLPALINIVTSVFQQSWQISSVKQLEADDHIKFYSRVFSMYFSAVAITGAIILLLVPYISMFVLQGEFYQAWIYTPLLLFSAMLGCLSVYFGTFYTVAKKSKSVMTTTMFGAVANIVFCFALIPIWGIYGALIGSVLSYAIIVLVRYLDTQRFMPIEINKTIVLTSLGLLLIESIGMTIDTYYTRLISLSVALAILIINSISLYSLYQLAKKKT